MYPIPDRQKRAVSDAFINANRKGWDFMKNTNVIDYTYVGVDVSKAKLDMYRASTKKSETFNNEEADM